MGEGSAETYWLKDSKDEAIGHLETYHNKWGLWNTSPIRESWVRNFLSYHSAVINPSSWDTSFVYEGVQGELLKFYTPKARNLIRQLINLITKDRLSFHAMAQSSGKDIIQDVKLSNAVLEQIVDNQRLNNKAEDLIENALVLGSSFLKTSWRTDHGDAREVYQGKVIYTGSVEISVCNVFDTFYDINVKSWDELDWVEVRTIKNRWDLIAQHPGLKDDILALPSWAEIRGPNYWFDNTNQDDDTVCIYECYAKPSPSLPKGRLIVYGDTNCVLFDGPNPYGFIPVEPMTPEKIQGTTLGYPKFTDLIASNEMLDNSLSSLATNQSQFATQSVLVPRGSNINVQDLNGMRFVSYTPQNAPGGGRPEPLQLTNSPAEVFKLSDILEKNMGELSGVHPIIRGDSAGATSGSMVATLTASAIEEVSSLSKSYHLCLERTMKKAIDCYKRFAKLEQNISITGKNNQVYSKAFTGKHLENIRGVKIQTTSPLMHSTAGRMEIAQQLQQMPEEMRYQYISIIEGRPLSEVTEKYLSQSDLVWSENESLTEGHMVPAMATDDHPYHIKNHSQILNDPEIRKNSDKIDIILSHIEEHLKLEKETDPELLAMIRGTQMPMAPEPEGEQEGMEELLAPPAEEGIEMASKVAEPSKDLLGRQV